jgi:dihydroorotase
MSVRPARIGRVGDHGRPLEVGQPANLTLLDPDATWTVDPSAQQTASRNTPFAGRQMHGQVVATFLRGRATVLDRQPVRLQELV